MQKTGITVLVIVVALGVAIFAGSRYLVSKLDGSGVPAPAQSGQVEYRAEELGLAFNYPDTYQVEVHGTQLVLLPKGYMPPAGGEGPPTISIQVLPNPATMPLEQWVRTDPRSNFQLASQERLDPVVVGGRTGVRYQHSGLYETDAVAAEYRGAIYLFSVGWLTPQDGVRQDFENLLRTVQFI